MLKLALLRGLVVVGVGREHGVHAAQLLQPAHVAQQRAGRVMGAADPHRNPAGRRLDHGANRQQPLFLIQRGCFARRSAGDDKVDSRVNLPVHQRLQRRLVNRSVRPEGRYDRCTATCGFHI